jgi:hypothetical protein
MTTTTPASRGPSPLFRRLLPALLLACFASIVFWWNPYGKQPTDAYFHVLLFPSVAGETTLAVNIDGTGLRKEHAQSQAIEAGKINHVCFIIRAGKLSKFLLTPLTTEGEVTLIRCWMATESGELAANLPPASLAASIPGIVPDSTGAVRLPSRVGEVSLGLEVKPNPPIDLAATPPPPAWQIVIVFLAVLVMGMFLPQVAARVAWRKHGARLMHWAHRRPRTAILAVAVVSATISCFPVIFCGKSFVSPDNGLQLLYEKWPTMPGALGGRVENPSGSDIGAVFYWHLPASIVQHRAIFEDGEFPLWNRYNWGGVPLWAQCMSMFGDPLHWPAVITGGAAWAWDFKFVAAKILFALGIGLLVLTTSRSLSAALLLTLSAPFIGFFVYRFCHPGVFAMSYAPWILLPWLEAVRAPSRRAVAGWAALLIFANWWQLNGGTAKEASAFLLCLNAAGALALLAAPLPDRERAVRFGMFAWASLLFLLLSAPLWMIFLDGLSKASTFYDRPQIFQIQPSLFIGLFDDIFYRQLMPAEFMSNPSANFLVLLGAAWALVRARILAADRSFVAVAVVAVGAAAIAFGVVSPLFLEKIPMIRNIYHFDDTFSGVLFVLLFVIAGYGLRECRRRMRLAEWRGDWTLVMCFVGVLVAAFFGLTQASHRVGTTVNPVGSTIPTSDFLWEYGAAIVVALAILPWAWRAVRLRQPSAATWLLVACAAWVTMHFRHGMHLVTNFDIYTMNPKTRLDIREVPSPAIEQVAKLITEPVRVSGVDWTMTGTNVLTRFEAIDGADALQNPAMRELTKAIGLRDVWGWRLLVLRQDFAKVHRGLDMLGVRYFLDKPNRGKELAGVKHLGGKDLDVLESETAWPRAFFTGSVLGYQDVKQLKGLIDEGDGRPFAVMLAPDRARLPLPPADFAQRKIVKAHNYRLTQNSTTFEVEAPTAGVAVLHEAWLPGDIQVTVDGQPAEVLRVNHAFRGVYLEQPGRHVIKFRYWPAVLDRALWMALAGAIGVLVSGWFLVRKPQGPVVQVQEMEPERIAVEQA